MATINNGASNGCTFHWKIKNISHCWLQKGEIILSPSFIADALEGTTWLLQLYPKGETDENNVSFYLHREIDCLGRNDIEVNYQLSFLDKNGSFLKERKVTKRFTKGLSWGFAAFELREKVFASERKAFLPEDTLTVQCSIWKKEETLCKPKYLYAQMVFKVNRRSFVWKIDEFSTNKTDTIYMFKDDLIDFDLKVNNTLHFTKKLDINIISFDESTKYFSFKISVINSYGEKEDCGALKYFAGDLKAGLLSMIMFSKMLTENKARYLPNDVLSLYCEYVSSNGAFSYEFCRRGKIYPNVTKVVDEKSREHCIEKEKSQILPVLMNDLKSVYNYGIFSDTELRTATKTFKAHKIILSARSPVFRRMFSNMKENNSGHIDLTDLEDDTIHRMLLYIYTDTVEDLQFENGCKLYSAADKYEILSLKSKCSSFLKDNLCLTKACDVLVLADLHQDDDLKTAVKAYILKHAKEVFGSPEWKHFMVSNIQLAADMMYQKFLTD